MPILIGRNGSSPTASRALLLRPQQKPLRNTSSSSRAERANCCDCCGEFDCIPGPGFVKNPASPFVCQIDKPDSDFVLTGGFAAPGQKSRLAFHESTYCLRLVEAARDVLLAWHAGDGRGRPDGWRPVAGEIQGPFRTQSRRTRPTGNHANQCAGQPHAF